MRRCVLFSFVLLATLCSLPFVSSAPIPTNAQPTLANRTKQEQVCLHRLVFRTILGGIVKVMEQVRADSTPTVLKIEKIETRFNHLRGEGGLYICQNESFVIKTDTNWDNVW